MRLYISDIKAFMLQNGVELVTDTRKRQIHAYMQAEDKARCLASGLLLREVCGVTDDSQLVFGINGKPYLKSGEVYFNISHSGDYVALATAGREVGVDIEKTAPYEDSVADRCFTGKEREWMLKEGGNEAFYRLWTAKESLMKATGLGFLMPPESFSVLPADSSAHRIDGRVWFLDWVSYDGHIICRALEGEDEKTEITIVKSCAKSFHF